MFGGFTKSVEKIQVCLKLEKKKLQAYHMPAVVIRNYCNEY